MDTQEVTSVQAAVVARPSCKEVPMSKSGQAHGGKLRQGVRTCRRSGPDGVRRRGHPDVAHVPVGGRGLSRLLEAKRPPRDVMPASTDAYLLARCSMIDPRVFKGSVRGLDLAEAAELCREEIRTHIGTNPRCTSAPN